MKHRLSESEIANLKQIRLRWFVDKLIELSNKPITLMGGYDEYIVFPALLLKTETDYFPPDTCEKQADGPEDEYCIYECGFMLNKIKDDLQKADSKYFGPEAKNFHWREDQSGQYGKGYVYLISSNVALLEAYLRYLESGISKPISLSNKKVDFDEVSSSIMIDGKRCSLPAAKNEEYLARAIFSREPNESVDWSIVYNEMSGLKDVIGTKKNKKTLVDTINRLNERVKRIFNTEDKLITCEGNNVRRNF